MDKYEHIEIVGEGSYGIVMKCRHKETKQIVAIKKFLETEDDLHIRKMAYREIKLLKKLRHENLVNLIEVFRRRKRFYLVFEYLDHTILDELESAGGGLGFDVSKRHMFQVLRGLNYCHTNYIIHRDIKPENVLVSPNGVVKLCDFGFARIITAETNESCTDYVATRWYRAPELLVGDTRYGKPVDIWASGCLYAEMVSGDPLFPGDSDIDQLHKIIKILGNLCGKHQSLIGRNHVRMLRRPIDDLSIGSSVCAVRSLRVIFPSWNSTTLDFLSQCLRMDPDSRPNCSNLLQHPLFVQDGFNDKFVEQLRIFIEKESLLNPLLQKRDEMRRLSILSMDDQKRINPSNTKRWQINLLRDARTENEKSRKITEFLNGQGNIQGTPIINRLRESSQIGPLSHTSSTTYIRKLDQKENNGCILPALPTREITIHSKSNVKKQRPEMYNFP